VLPLSFFARDASRCFKVAAAAAQEVLQWHIFEDGTATIMHLDNEVLLHFNHTYADEGYIWDNSTVYYLNGTLFIP
jgi:hypothetical protein